MSEKVKSIEQYRDQYFPKDKQAKLMELSPEEFGAYLAREVGQAYLAVIRKFLKKQK